MISAAKDKARGEAKKSVPPGGGLGAPKPPMLRPRFGKDLYIGKYFGEKYFKSGQVLSEYGEVLQPDTPLTPGFVKS